MSRAVERGGTMAKIEVQPNENWWNLKISEFDHGHLRTTNCWHSLHSACCSQSLESLTLKALLFLERGDVVPYVDGQSKFLEYRSSDFSKKLNSNTIFSKAETDHQHTRRCLHLICGERSLSSVALSSGTRDQEDSTEPTERSLSVGWTAQLSM